MDGLIKMCREERVNDYFKQIAHAQIEIGFRILEYLEPDSVFKKENLSKGIMDKFLRNDVIGAVSDIFFELNINDDYGIEKEATEFASEVLLDFIKKKKQEKLSEREQLLIRLGELETELDQ